MDATIIVCTYNRCDSLKETLEAIGKLRVPAGFSWELVVVNNNSSDATEVVVQQFSVSHRAEVPVQYVLEPRQGLSIARNSGLRHAQGEYLAFTDDDVLPAPDWLFTLVDSMRRHSCAAAGGYIAPIWQGTKPAWLTERFYGFLALRTDEGEARRLRDSAEMPFGANMAFHRRVFEQLGGFDPTLGRNGNVLAGGEEIDVFMRALASGESVMYVPEARVRHKVEAFRLHKGYFRRWRYHGSFNLAFNEPPAAGRQLAGVPLYLFSQLARATWRSAVLRLTSPADEAFRQEMIVWHFFGLIRGRAAGARARR